ncbi:MAG: bleomycin resistance protein [Hyphomicrobiales bacterium]|nr:bleomycin resistance protein [Hyphomicrobiales bacterium]
MKKARITEQAPILFVSDLPASVDYWVDKLGFTVGGVYGEPRPEFAILRRDRANVMLSRAPDGHQIVPSWRVKDKTWNVYFWVDDARAMFDELKGRGAIIDYELGEQPYGVLEFGIRDPDDQDIAFGEDLERQG